MKLAVATLLALALWPTVAQAHRISEADAESRWYYVMNHYCDVGGTCSLRRASVTCWPRVGGPHSYNCDYEYRQERADFPFGKDYRWCHVTGVLQHTTVLDSYTRRNCTGWS